MIAIKLMDSSKQVLQSKTRSSSLSNLVLLHVFFHNMNDEDLFIHWKIEWPITQLMLNHSNIELLQSNSSSSQKSQNKKFIYFNLLAKSPKLPTSEIKMDALLPHADAAFELPEQEKIKYAKYAGC